MADTISRKSIVYDITFNTNSANKAGKETGKVLDDLNKKSEGLSSTFGSLGKQLAGAFAAAEVIRGISQFSQEAFKLGLKAEGVSKAFKELNNPNLLSNLRKATRGTVDDLTLMQAAVRADKFKIPLDNLAKLFKFASIRARETGQSVNYLVDSIIDGIGRKSPLILDNLGLSAQELQKEFAKTGDFAKAVGNVISDSMKDSGKEILSNADKVDQLATSWENFKLNVGASLVDAFGTLDTFGEKIESILDKLPLFGGGVVKEGFKRFEEQQERNNDAIQAGAEILSRLYNPALNTTELSLKEIQDRLGELNAEFAETTDPRVREELAKQILRFQEMEAAIKKLLEPAQKVKEIFKGISELKTFLPKNIVTELQQATNELTLFAKAWDELNGKTSEWITLADGTLIKGTIPEVKGGLRDISVEQKELSDATRDALITNAEDILTSLIQLSKDGSKAQLAFAGVAIFANQAKALSGAIAAATEAAGQTGGLSLPVLISSFVSIALSTFAQVNSLLNQARAAESAVAFAEGEIDIHREGETRGKDSIPAVIMPGESVITTDKTRQYKPFLEAIHAGNLEDLIRVNYVEPALALRAIDSVAQDSRQLDYTDKFYRQYLATGETNLNGKRMVRILGSIDRKLSSNKKRYH